MLNASDASLALEVASVCKHEPVACPRCGDEFVCKPGAVPICHCFEVKLSKEQREWIAERWEGCLCGSCLHTVAEEF